MDETSEAPDRKRPIYTSLFFQLLVGIVGGILVGWLFP